MKRDPTKQLFETVTNAYDVYELIAVLGTDLLPFMERLSPPVAAQSVLADLIGVIESILERVEVSPSDPDALRSVAVLLAERGIPDLATALHLWLRRHEQLSTNPQRDCGSEFDFVRFECACGTRTWATAWKVVNATYRPDLQERVRGGTIFPSCSGCGTQYYPPLFYCDPDRGEYLLFAPGVDEEDFKSLLNAAMGYIQHVPADLRRNVSNSGYYQGFPGPWIGPIDDFAAIFRVDSLELLHEIVTEDLIYDAQASQVNLEAYGLGVHAREAVERGAMGEAARLFARLFLTDQSQFNVLHEIGSCLRAAGDAASDDFLTDAAMRLREKLRAEKVVYDGRASNRYPSPSPAVIVEIWGRGLPAEWGYEAVVARVREVADGSA